MRYYPPTHPSMYPDLNRDGSRLQASLRAEALDWITGMPVQWAARSGDVEPDARRPIEPSEALAIIGALRLSALIDARQPHEHRMEPMYAWSGCALHGRQDPIDLILGASLQAGTVRGAPNMTLTMNSRTIRLHHAASKLWAGQITPDGIWETCQNALKKMKEQAWINGSDASPLPLDARTDEKITGTGYDYRLVNDPIHDGFSGAEHKKKIVLVGGRPAIELYAYIGAAMVEAAGRWERVHQPLIPVLDDVPLRDWLDCERWLMVAPTMVVEYRQAAKRGYLV